MTLYITNNKYYFNSLDNAIEKAKEIVRHYNDNYKRIIDEEWKITQGKNGGYCVKLANVKYYNQVIIKTVKTED